LRCSVVVVVLGDREVADLTSALGLGTSTPADLKKIKKLRFKLFLDFKKLMYHLNLKYKYKYFSIKQTKTV
jgi:hypothetical protein